MPRGGARAGAGRKKGQATRKSQEVADQAAREGITPLEVMLFAMRHHQKAKEYDKAAEIAKDAAPYMHPRLSAVSVTGKNGGAIQVSHEYQQLSALSSADVFRLYRETLAAPATSADKPPADGARNGDVPH